MNEQLRQLHIVWLAFLAAVIAYLPVPWLVVAAGADDAPPAPAGIHSGLNFAALGAGIASFIARRWWSNSLRAAAGADEGTGARTDLWPRLRAGCIVTWALSEVVAILGLAMGILLREPAEAVPPVVAAGLLLYLHRPDRWPLDRVQRGTEAAA